MAKNITANKGPNGDYTIAQDWHKFSEDEHELWRFLYDRQMKILPERAHEDFMRGLDEMAEFCLDGIPDYSKLNKKLMDKTGWQIVAVEGLIPDAPFFNLLANRKFPAGNFLRSKEQMDYLQEPDIFHDVFGHVPMLFDPVFADYMEAYGKAGARAIERGKLKNLARLYWYTVEFGLMKSQQGDLRIYGAGIVSSYGETIFALDNPSPHRIEFNLKRLMRTTYRIDDFQEIYFVIDSIQDLFEQTYQDFGAIYDWLDTQTDLQRGFIYDGDVVLHKGTRQYFIDKGEDAKDGQG